MALHCHCPVGDLLKFGSGGSGHRLGACAIAMAKGVQGLTLRLTYETPHHMAKYKASGMDRTFAALADPTRRAVLLRLEQEPGLSVSELARPFSLKLPGMMKHLDVLSDAGLITRDKTGRTVSVHLSVGPMQEAMEWLKRYERFWTVSLDRLVALVEDDQR